MNNIELVKKIRKDLGLTQEQFAQKIGLKKGSYANIEAGIDPLIDRTINAIKLAFPEISSEYLNNRTGASLKKTQPSSGLKAAIDRQNKRLLSEDNPLESHFIPLVSVAAVGGFGNAEFAIKESDVKDYYVVPKFKDRRIDFMIEVAGSSMQPKYNSGDVVACTILKESRFIQWGKVHVIGTREQGVLIKRLYPCDNDDKKCIKCQSDNDKYPPFEVTHDEITGIALVVGVIRLE
jgi:phage repressor protein C with HTH and peptisase S24 domain